MPDEPTSFMHAAFLRQRDLFEAEYERFLTSLATPVEARRQEVADTISRLEALAKRLRDQGVL